MLELQKPENPCSVHVFWVFPEIAWRRMNDRQAAHAFSLDSKFPP